MFFLQEKLSVVTTIADFPYCQYLAEIKQDRFKFMVKIKLVYSGVNRTIVLGKNFLLLQNPQLSLKPLSGEKTSAVPQLTIFNRNEVGQFRNHDRNIIALFRSGKALFVLQKLFREKKLPDIKFTIFGKAFFCFSFRDAFFGAKNFDLYILSYVKNL